jgi:GNAT superfamily N-acetyltransferase
MTLMWTKEASARWDANRQRLFGPAELAAVGLAAPEPEAPVADEWWRVTDGDDVAGYGWLDSEWGDARITFFVAPGQRSRGVGHFILEHLEAEAAARRLNYIYNVVPETHSARPIALPPGLAEWHAPFLIDVARCHAQTGNPRAAEDALAEAERAAPDEVRHHRLTRDLVGELLPRSSRRAKIRALARRCQVSG